MDGHHLPSISPTDLHRRLAVASAPLLIDVHRDDSFVADDRLIIGAFHRAPADVEHWRRELPTGRPVVVYCGRGGQSNQGIVNALRTAGLDAVYLEGGIAGWEHAGLPTRKKLAAAARQWVTREHPKIDRIACPWLISRVINAHAELVYVPASEALGMAAKTGATPHDIRGAEFGHVDDHCSFDAVIRIFGIHDPALDHLATIVRGADPRVRTSRRNARACSPSHTGLRPTIPMTTRCSGTAWSSMTRSTHCRLQATRNRSNGLGAETTTGP